MGFAEQSEEINLNSSNAFAHDGDGSVPGNGCDIYD